MSNGTNSFDVLITNDLVFELEVIQGDTTTPMKLKKIKFIIGYGYGSNFPDVLIDPQSPESLKRNLILCKPFINNFFIFNKIRITINEDDENSSVYTTEIFDSIDNFLINSPIINNNDNQNTIDTFFISFIKKQINTVSIAQEYLTYNDNAPVFIHTLDFNMDKFFQDGVFGFNYNGINGIDGVFQNKVRVDMIYSVDGGDGIDDVDNILKSTLVSFELKMTTTGNTTISANSGEGTIDTSNTVDTDEQIEYGDIQKLFEDNIIITPELIDYGLSDIKISSGSFKLNIADTKLSFDHTGFPATYNPFYSTGNFYTFTIDTSDTKLLILGKVNDEIISFFGNSEDDGIFVTGDQELDGNGKITTILLQNDSDNITINPSISSITLGVDSELSINNIITFLTQAITFEFILTTTITISKVIDEPTRENLSFLKRKNPILRKDMKKIKVCKEVTINPLLQNINIIIFSFVCVILSIIQLIIRVILMHIN